MVNKDDDDDSIVGLVYLNADILWINIDLDEIKNVPLLNCTEIMLQ